MKNRKKACDENIDGVVGVVCVSVGRCWLVWDAYMYIFDKVIYIYRCM